MEEMTPELNPQENPSQEQPVPQRRRRTASPKFTLKVPALLTELGRDVRWYYDVRLWLPVILVLLILSMCAGSKLNSAPQEETQPQLQETEQATEPEQTEPPTAAAPIDPEAEALAILADSVGAGRSDNVKTIIMWVAINRSEDYANGHGLSLLEEIARPDQWQGYNPEAAYTQRTYEIALEVLETRDTGALRPLDGDMLWLVLNDDGSVTVRNMYTAKADQKWREKTVK